ncbi:MAG: AAA family ATPase, partial [Deltaproteobacteria bacterium]|nr:AAA family ATPase [Deltaproteobacteria bacterium]
LSYFGLTENPFDLTPDPRFLFMSQRHREALAHLLFGMGEKGGFVLLTGEVGTGKTTLCRSLLEQVPEGVEVALVLNPKQTSLELVASLCDELKVSYPTPTKSLKVLIDHLNRHLLDIHAQGRRTVVIIDEAQNLSIEVLEQVRLLTNLETTTRKLLQILLIGQPELQGMMAQPELRQLGQRITARYHLTPLSHEETAAYIEHRLEVAGCKRPLFTRSTLHLIHRLSSGIPRLINTICDRALLGAYGRKHSVVNRRLARSAAAEVMGKKALVRSPGVTGWLLALLFLVLLGAGWFFFQNSPWRAQWQEDSSKIATNEKPERAPETLDDVFYGGKTHARMQNALQSLLKHWGLAIPNSDGPAMLGRSVCEWAPSVGYRCYSGKGNWTTLKHLNRPAVLELIDDRGRRHYVAAMQIKDQKVLLDFGDSRLSLSRNDLDPFWFGGFTLIWKPPPIKNAILKKGDSGPDVRWLKAQLNRIEGVSNVSDGMEEAVFDDILEMRVMKFQRSYAVEADGIVGEQTLIQLTKAEREPPSRR